MEPLSSQAKLDWVIDALAMELAEAASGPLSRRLYRGLRERIQAGRLAPGSRLPSSRRLARELCLGRNTVLAALEQLVAEGFLETRPGAGTFIADLPRLAGSSSASRLASAPAGAAPGTATAVALSSRGTRLLGYSAGPNARPGVFTPGVPALDRFPQALWQRLMRRHLHRAPTDWLGYQTHGGVPALREALCDYLRLSRSVRCRPEQILIVQGAQQGFELIARLLTDPGDRVWVEEPGYGGAKACFEAAGLEMRPVPVDDEGLRVAADLPEPRLIQVTPSHQYPSGVTMTLGRRLALLEAAERHGSWIVEDDYDSEFRYGQRPIAALQGLDNGGRVLYVGTFSKVLYPGLRLGYVVLPEPWWTRVGGPTPGCIARGSTWCNRHWPSSSPLATSRAMCGACATATATARRGCEKPWRRRSVRGLSCRRGRPACTWWPGSTTTPPRRRWWPAASTKASGCRRCRRIT